MRLLPELKLPVSALAAPLADFFLSANSRNDLFTTSLLGCCVNSPLNLQSSVPEARGVGREQQCVEVVTDTGERVVREEHNAREREIWEAHRLQTSSSIRTS